MQDANQETTWYYDNKSSEGGMIGSDRVVVLYIFVVLLGISSASPCLFTVSALSSRRLPLVTMNNDDECATMTSNSKLTAQQLLWRNFCQAEI